MVHCRNSASSPTRSLTFGRWGCGERGHLSHVVSDSVVILSEMSRQVASKTLSEALRHAKVKIPTSLTENLLTF